MATRAKGSVRPCFELYKAADGWRWRLVAANNRIIADSGEAYTRKADVARSLERFVKIVGTADIKWKDTPP